MTRLLRPRPDGERGAVAVVVALLAVVLFGFGALVVDVGALYAERRELQNGADAASLAIAQECGEGTCSPATADATSAALADQNARDGSAAVTEICSNAPELAGAPVITCAAPAGLPLGARFVRVDTQTRQDSGTTSEIAPVLSGVLGSTGSTVRSRSVAVWGGLGEVDGALPLTISYCEWGVLTDGGSQLLDWPASAETVLSSDLERKLVFFGGDDGGGGGGGGSTTTTGDGELHDCREAAAGHDLPEEPVLDTPGGFGWADGARDDCSSTDITTDDDGASTYERESGNAAFRGCVAELDRLYQLTVAGTPELLFLPTYQSVDGSTYTLQASVGFILTGYRFGTACGGAPRCERPSPVDNAMHDPGELCHARDWDSGVLRETPDSNQNCITGFFVRAAPPDPSAPVAGPSLGVTVVNLFE